MLHAAGSKVPRHLITAWKVMLRLERHSSHQLVHPQKRGKWMRTRRRSAAPTAKAS